MLSEVPSRCGRLIYGRHAGHNSCLCAALLTDYYEGSMTSAGSGNSGRAASALPDAGFGDFHRDAKFDLAHDRVQAGVAGALRQAVGRYI